MVSETSRTDFFCINLFATASVLCMTHSLVTWVVVLSNTKKDKKKYWNLIYTVKQINLLKHNTEIKKLFGSDVGL